MENNDDAELGRLAHWLGLWGGCSLIVCAVYVSIFGEDYKNQWIRIISFCIVGVIMAYLIRGKRHGS